MRIGLSVYSVPASELLELAVAADETGFDAIWLGEHVLLPCDYDTPHPTQGMSYMHHTGPIISPDTELLDPLVALSAASVMTRSLHFATGVYILPLRHPLLTARATCTLHDISGGRFMLGVGAGWLGDEFTALDVAFDTRGQRFEESIEVLRAAWSGGPLEYHGKHFDFGPIQISARPVNVPIVFGGNSERALRRAARLGDAWFASGTPTLDEGLALRDAITAFRDQYGRTGPFRYYLRVVGADPELFERYHAEGIDDVIVWADQVWPSGDIDTKRASLQATARLLGIA